MYACQAQLGWGGARKAWSLADTALAWTGLPMGRGGRIITLAFFLPKRLSVRCPTRPSAIFTCRWGNLRPTDSSRTGDCSASLPPIVNAATCSPFRIFSEISCTSRSPWSGRTVCPSRCRSWVGRRKSLLSSCLAALQWMVWGGGGEGGLSLARRVVFLMGRQFPVRGTGPRRVGHAPHEDTEECLGTRRDRWGPYQARPHRHAPPTPPPPLPPCSTWAPLAELRTPAGPPRRPFCHVVRTLSPPPRGQATAWTQVASWVEFWSPPSWRSATPSARPRCLSLGRVNG